MRILEIAVIAALLLSVMASQASAFIPERTCINQSYLSTSLTYTDEDGNTTIMTQKPLYCPYGCMDNMGRYGASCSNPPYALPLVFFLIMLGSAATVLIVGVFKKHWLLCSAASVAFIYMAFQSFMVEIDSDIYMIIPLVIVSWALCIVSFIFTLIGLKSYYDENNQPSERPRRD